MSTPCVRQSEPATRTRAVDTQMPTPANASEVFKISVVIPTHNRAVLVLQAITSVLHQTYPVHEIIVVDDGSSDDTKEVLYRFLSSVTSAAPVRYLHQQQQGVSVARNTGINAATGDWLAFLDSDDLWLPEKLAWQVKALQQYAETCQACVTDSRYANNPLLSKSAFTIVGHNFSTLIGIFPECARRITSRTFHGAHLPTLLVRRDLVRSLGGFHAAFPVNEDTDFFFNLAQRTSVCYVNIPLIEIDRTPDRKMGLNDLRKKEAYYFEMAQRLYEKWLSDYRGDDPLIPKRIRHRLHDVHVGWSSWYLVEGYNHRALHSISLAFRYHPSLKAALKWTLIKCTPGLLRKELIRRRTKEGPPLL